MTKKAMPFARVGDVFLILVPDKSELDATQRLQKALQSHFGGHFTTPVHVTYQRFSPLLKPQLVTLIETLQHHLLEQEPLSVTGHRLEIMYSPFHQVEILKCQIVLTDQLHLLGLQIKQILTDLGIQGHYPSVVADHVTLLDDVKKIADPTDQTVISLPCHLFTGREMLISTATGINRYELIANIPFATI